MDFLFLLFCDDYDLFVSYFLFWMVFNNIWIVDVVGMECCVGIVYIGGLNFGLVYISV